MAVEITWVGHSCFRLRSEDLTVVTDPFPASLGLRPETRPATVVTISNRDPNFGNWREVGNEPKVFDTPGEYEYSGIGVQGVMTTLPAGVPQRQRNVAYTIELDGVHICHLGAINAPLTAAQAEELAPVDVLLVPVGGLNTLDLDGVIQIMQDLDPKIVIPMQFQIPGVKLELQPVGAFLRRIGVTEAAPQPRLSVTASNLPSEQRIVALSHTARPA